MRRDWFDYLPWAIGIAAVLLVGAIAYHLYERSFLVEGVVVSKDFYPEHEETQIQWIYNDKGEIVGSYPVTTHYPDAWVIRIEGIDTRGQENWRVLNLTEREWAPLRVGQRWSVTERRVVDGKAEVES